MVMAVGIIAYVDSFGGCGAYYSDILGYCKKLIHQHKASRGVR